MIKLFDNEEQNKQLREIIAEEKQSQQPGNWKYWLAPEKTHFIAKKYNCSIEMAKKVVWIMIGNDERQLEICNTFGKEYMFYTPNCVLFA